jgi:hypothetical protein
MDVLFPLILPTVTDNADLSARVRRLETTLALSLELVQLLFERLEDKLGPGFLGEELQRLTTYRAADARQEAARIDALVRQGRQPEAARVLREVAGVTWDQAHDVTRRWQASPLEQTVRWLQLTQLLRVMS